ncbi:MAG: metallophosphatase [Leeuwenhoekiella sp.]
MTILTTPYAASRFFLVLLFITALVSAQEREISQVFYFTGNTGVDEGEYSPKILDAINEMSQKDTRATFVALGNITKNGFPKNDDKRKKVKETLRKRLMQPLERFNGNVIFIPGQNEWRKNGHKALDDMESFIQDNSKAEFWPNDGCVREIENLDTENVELLMIDSQWFLEDWDDHIYINNDCGIKTRADFFTKFKDDLKDEQNKTVIVAIHHSVLSESKQSFIEKIGGTKKEDFYSAARGRLRGQLEALAVQFPDVIFVSASDENLQYINDDGIPQIISGAAGKKLRNVKKADDDEILFTKKAHGFAKLTVYSDNSSTVEFYSTENGSAEKLFEKDIKRQQTTKDEVTFGDIEEYDDTIEASVYAPEETKKSGFYTWFFGNHYRDVYSTEIEVPVLDLDDMPDNVRAISEGGGNQSRSLRLIDDNEHEYTVRELRKSATRFIQSKVTDHYVVDYMKNTVAEELVQDFYTTAHPYAPFALNTIFDSLQILNAEPKIFYLPKQKRLGIYNENYGDKLYMLEAHAGDENKEFALFGNPDDIISTADLLEEMRESKEDYVNEDTYIKERLTDILIGDWDRHYDQWRWAAYEQPDGTTKYEVIRRDRDQAFSKYDGAFVNLLKMGFAAFRTMQTYDEDVRSIKWLTIAGYPLDQTILKNSDWEAWQEQVDFIQNTLTDETIAAAFKTLPENAQDESVSEIIENLKGRRDNLEEIARDYYEFLNKHQIIMGTEEKDTFLITRKPDGVTNIRITAKDSLVYDNDFKKELTKEIWIYGLDDEDTFKIEGNGDHLIPLKILGGENNDTYDFKNRRRAKVYDYKSKKNTFEQNNIRKWLVDSYDINYYDADKRKMNTNTIFPSIGFDPDAGFKVGLRDTYTVQGLTNNPFSSKHTVTAAFYSATSGLELQYSGEFAHIFYNWNFGLDARFTSPNYAINYFGTGNGTFYDDDAVDRNFNRVKIAQWSVAPSLIYRKNGFRFNVGPILESLNVEFDANDVTAQQFAQDNDVFRTQEYLGGEASFQYVNKDALIAYPRRGYQIDLTAGYKTTLDSEYDNNFSYLKPSVSVDYPLHDSGIVVLATKLGGHFNFGGDYEFYHGATVGGNKSLRGFRNERFNGNSAFYQSTDLRIGLAQFRTSFVPVRMGITGGFDYGRVWTDMDVNESDNWHTNYGGSIFLNGFNALTANVGYYVSPESNRIVFTLGFAF